MKSLQYIIGICIPLAFGCVEEEYHSMQFYPEPQIIGGEYPAFGTVGRAAGSTTFLAGDKVLFFSEGGMTAENVILTYDGYMWQPDRTLEWEKNERVRFTAVYPILERDENGNYDTEQLYDNGINGLEDILFCKDSCERSNVITLQFSHRFAQLNFIADRNMNGQISELQCITPAIESFNLRTGEITYASQTHSDIIRKTKCSTVPKQNVPFLKTKRTSVNPFFLPHRPNKKAPKGLTFPVFFLLSAYLSISPRITNLITK